MFETLNKIIKSITIKYFKNKYFNNRKKMIKKKNNNLKKNF